MLRFGPFTLDSSQHQLSVDGQVVPLTPKAIDTLQALVSQSGRLVTKAQLLEAVWGDTFVAEIGLTRNISVLRKTLAAYDPGHEYIETVPKRGYKFVAPVRELTAPSAEPHPAASPGPRTEPAAPTRLSYAFVPVTLIVLLVAIVLNDSRRSGPLSAGPEPAAQAYERGRHFWGKRSPADLETAIAAFSEAIDHNPRYAPAYAGLADCYSMMAAFYPVEASVAFPRARAAAEKALALDDSLAEAHASLGFELFAYEWNWAGAEREYKRAIELKPDYATAHQWYAVLLMVLGRPDESLKALETAERLDPLSPAIGGSRVELLFMARRYDESIEAGRALFQLQPDNLRAFPVEALIATGRWDEAIAAIEQRNSKQPGAPALLTLARAHTLRGNRREAERLLERVRQEQATTGKYAPPFERAVLYAAMGKADEAFTDLESLFNERYLALTWLKVTPSLDSLRSDPRYADLVRRMGL